MTAEFEEDEDPTEAFEEEEPVTGREEGMGTRVERTLQEPSEHFGGEEAAQARQDDTPEGLGMRDFSGSGVHEDELDALFQNPEFRARVKELLGK